MRWIALGGDNASALPAPALREVEAPSLKEEMGDEVPWEEKGDALPDLVSETPKKKKK